MEFELTDFRDAISIINCADANGNFCNPELHQRYQEFIEVIKGISDADLINKFNSLKENIKGMKSISHAINYLIKERMELIPGWESESFIFNDEEYSERNTEWRLDFASDGTFAIEVAFNHGEAIAWNLSKLAISGELNHVKKKINTKMGIYVCETDAMKKAGNFDSASGAYEKVLRYLIPMRNLLTVPIVLIGLKAPESFKINPTSRLVEYL